MDNLPGWALAIVYGGGFALILGFFVARKAHRRKPVQGGALAHLLHYLGAVASIAPAPMLLIGGFVYRIQFGQAAGLCLGSLALGFVLLMGFAVFEPKTSG